MRELITKPLSGKLVDQAFPLVQAALPSVDLEQWRHFAGQLICPEAPDNTGILSVLTEQGYIAGLSIYRIEPSLAHGPVLIADHFMALDLFNRAAVVNALADFLEDLARRRGCTALHTHIPEKDGVWQGPADGLVSILRDRGHAIESLRLCKQFGNAAQLTVGTPRDRARLA